VRVLWWRNRLAKGQEASLARGAALLYIVENVEAEVCQECGERYYHARVLDNIDALIQREHEVKQILSVEVLTA